MKKQIHTWFATRAALGVAVLAAGWPVLIWYFRRTTDGSDEPLGVLALVATVAFAWREEWRAPANRPRLLGCAAALALYFGATLVHAPELVRALFWIGALAAIAVPQRGALATATLLGLSLPWIATVQFYLGFPLRWLATVAASGALRVAGIVARAEGTSLVWAGERVLVDAPCAGIQMGWTLAFVTALLAAWQGSTASATVRLLRAAGLVAFVANVVRVCALFEVETHHLVFASWLHDAIGLAIFATAVVALIAIDQRRFSVAATR